MMFWTVERGRLFSRQKPLTLQPFSFSADASLRPMASSTAVAGDAGFISIVISIAISIPRRQTPAATAAMTIHEKSPGPSLARAEA